mgnify:CR=1 FL=1
MSHLMKINIDLFGHWYNNEIQSKCKNNSILELNILHFLIINKLFEG